jgi:hypothetical protein
MNVNELNYQDFLAKNDITESQVNKFILLASFLGYSYDKYSAAKFLNEFIYKLKNG